MKSHRNIPEEALSQLTRSLSILFRSGGAKTLLAENLLLKHQLMIARRSGRRAPNLRRLDRLLFELAPCFWLHAGWSVLPSSSNPPPYCAVIERSQRSNSTGSSLRADITNPVRKAPDQT